MELLIGFNFQSSEQVEGTKLAQRIKDDLEGTSKPLKGLDHNEVLKVLTQSPAINKWLKPQDR